jgi:hypothetical protein
MGRNVAIVRNSNTPPPSLPLPRQGLGILHRVRQLKLSFWGAKLEASETVTTTYPPESRDAEGK